jgi:glycolate oxidase
MTNAERERLLTDLRAIVGNTAVYADPATRLVYEADGLTLSRGQPDVVVLPRSTEEVVRIVRRTVHERLPLIARGAGSGLSGGCVPLRGGVVVSLARMNRILEIDAPNRVAVVQPGVVNTALSDAVRPYGLHFAPDPSSQQVSTIGGNVSENAGGPHCLKYGATTVHVLGMVIVLPDGSLVRLGNKCQDSIGYDLVGVVVGAEGTLGIVTEVTVRLTPLPEAVRTVLCAFPTMEAAGEAVSGVIGGGLVPASLEMLDNLTIRAVEAWLGLGLDVQAGALLLIEVDGSAAGIDDAVTAIVDTCRRQGATDVRAARTEAERQALWRGRKSAFGAYGRLSAGFYVMDPVVPRTQIPLALRRIAGAAERHALRVANVFHAGDGNLHPCVLFDPDVPGDESRAVALAHDVLTICIELDGALSGEHGIGVEKRELMPLVFNADDLAIMGAVRRAFDPDERMNPEKIFPTGRGAFDPARLRGRSDIWI